MDRTQIIAELEKNIADLSAARALLTNVEGVQTAAKRKIHVINKGTQLGKMDPIRPSRKQISAEGRARMAAAQQKRWKLKKREARAAQKEVFGKRVNA